VRPQLFLSLVSALLGCSAPRAGVEDLRPEPQRPVETAPQAPPLFEAKAPAPPSPAVVTLEHYAPEDAYVVRGSRATAQALLFGGQCAQSQFYADAIKLSAARHVQLVTLQGDAPCNGAFRGWRFDLDALSARIDRSFAALGLGEPRDVLLIGYSQGALVAARLAAREPEKFTRLVLMASPKPLEAPQFTKAQAVATMAGTLDRQDLMQRGAGVLSRAGVRARYFPLPGAAHGYMGTDPDGTFEGVFRWLEASTEEEP
jgi:predicted esterase